MKIVMAEEFNGQLYVRADVVQLHIKEAVNAEREACFKETYDVAMKAAEAGIDKAMELEREACAKVCENGTFLHDFSPEAVYSRACARAIRARGQA